MLFMQSWLASLEENFIHSYISSFLGVWLCDDSWVHGWVPCDVAGFALLAVGWFYLPQAKWEETKLQIKYDRRDKVKQLWIVLFLIGYLMIHWIIVIV